MMSGHFILPTFVQDLSLTMMPYENIVFVAGCEYSLYMDGFIKGKDTYERIAKMFNPVGIISNALGLRNKVYKKMNIFLNTVIKTIRSEFKGKVTYASGTWEKVNWIS